MSNYLLRLSTILKCDYVTITHGAFLRRMVRKSGNVSTTIPSQLRSINTLLLRIIVLVNVIVILNRNLYYNPANAIN